MTVLKLMGAVLLLGLVLIVMLQRRRELHRRRVLCDVWRAFLCRLQHRMEQCALPVRLALEESGQKTCLALSDGGVGDADFSLLCRMAGSRLGGRCGAALTMLPTTLGEAGSCPQASEMLREVLEALEDEEEQLELRLGRCHVLGCVAICGALGLILLMW